MLCLLSSSLWVGSCPTGVYKDHKTDSCSYPTESGDSLCYVFRRLPDFWEDQVRLPSRGKECNDTVTRAGVHNKYKESISEPTQQIEFLGLILDSIQMKVFLPEPKVLDLIESCQAILSMTSLTARSLASFQKGR